MVLEVEEDVMLPRRGIKVSREDQMKEENGLREKGNITPITVEIKGRKGS